MSEVLTNPYRFSTGISDSQLKAYYKFNETEGDVINVSESSDSLGDGADLQISGASYNQSESPFGYAMTFDGTNDNAKAGTSTSQFNFLHNSATMKWTMCFWANSSGGDGDGIIGTVRNGGDIGMIMRLRTGLSISFQIKNDDGNVCGSDGAVGYFTGTYRFYVCRYDQTLSVDNWQTLYNGSNLVDDTKSGTTPNAGDAEFPLTIASQANSTNYNPMGISEFSIWNRYLSDSDIAFLYNSGSGQAIY